MLIGTDGEFAEHLRAEDLVEIVENSMSSETYDLLKRPDEFFIVNKAHQNPKFVEDVVRGILARALDVYADFPDDTFISATQVNYESIHKHDAFAEAFGLFGEFRRELRDGVHVDAKTDIATWLGTRPSPVLVVGRESAGALGLARADRRAHRCGRRCAIRSPRPGTTCGSTMPNGSRRSA